MGGLTGSTCSTSNQSPGTISGLGNVETLKIQRPSSLVICIWLIHLTQVHWTSFHCLNSQWSWQTVPHTLMAFVCLCLHLFFPLSVMAAACQGSRNTWVLTEMRMLLERRWHYHWRGGRPKMRRDLLPHFNSGLTWGRRWIGAVILNEIWVG